MKLTLVISVASALTVAPDARAFPAPEEATHYSVTLRPDFRKQVFQGEEQLEFQSAAGVVQFSKQPGLRIAKVAGGSLVKDGASVRVRLRKSGRQSLRFRYTVAAGRGLKWLANDKGFLSTFYCDAWMICNDRPDHRATMRLEIVLPASDFLPVGPGRLVSSTQVKGERYYVFEQAEPVQTYLFSFAAARLLSSSDGDFIIYAGAGGHDIALQKTATAAAFFREKASTEPLNRTYTQVFLPEVGLGQEAAGLGLMSEEYLSTLEREDDVDLMAHELAHQWWGVLVGIRSWSDFWLNEGMAEFMADAFIERHQGRRAYEQRMAKLHQRMAALQKEGKDRPLHWDGWKDAHEARGPIPYVKGALFLDNLRKQLGETHFWRGIALYTRRHARSLVDARAFQRAMEEASGRSLSTLFDEAVYK
jgi:aminopeptidase N